MIDLKKRFLWGSVFSFIFFTIAIFGFGYIYVGVNGIRQPANLNLEKKSKDESISCQLANGNTVGIIVFLLAGAITLLYLVLFCEKPASTKNKIVLALRSFCIILLVCLVITIIWVSPYKVNYPKNTDPTDDNEYKSMQEKHNIIAMTSFTITLIYILLTYYSFDEKMPTNKLLYYTMYIFLLTSILAYLTLLGIAIATGSGKGETYDLVLFPIGEIVFYLSFLAYICVYGYYNSLYPKIIENKNVYNIYN